MEDVDTHVQSEYDDEAMFLSDVIGEEHELLFLDSYLREAFRGRKIHGGSGDIFGEESTL